MTICVFGDSIAFGMNDFEQGGWVVRLKRAGYSLANLSVGGETSSGVLDRIRRGTGKCGAVIIAGGANDSAYSGERSNAVTSIEDFEKNVEEMIRAAKVPMAFIGLFPVDENRTMGGEFSYDNENIGRYNRAVKKICKERGVPFVDLFEKFAKNYKALLDDGLHPNSEGHGQIAKVVEGSLKKFLAKN